MLTLPLPIPTTPPLHRSTVCSPAAPGLPAGGGLRPPAERHHQARLLGGSRGVDHAVRLLRPVDPLLHFLGGHVPHGPHLAQQV